MSDKVLFLDIDGVLCTLKSQYAYGERLLMEMWDITCCQMVRRLCAANGYQIVCSSTWRKQDGVRLYFAIFGLIEYLHKDWKTPILKETESGKRRGQEIQAWLDEHDIERYVIFDDDSDMLESQKEWFVQTDSYEGITTKNFDRADELMGGKFRDYMRTL